MRIFLSLIGITISFFMIKYRERLGELIGEGAWMDKVGGVYGVVIISALILFFWSIAYLTNTQSFFFMPILWLLPGTRGNGNIDGF